MPEDKKKKKGIEPEGLLAEMEDLERFNGATETKIVENWYELKKRIAQVIAEGSEKKDDTI